ncbi:MULTISPECIES: ABC transporter substrate-binding protein [unclassified Streptomyces]|uniref:ABC transporter substrate-binding protein n=1 Tax=unclassified Streptomyces TaxID=2593676 RepID=UPI0035DDF28B
MIRSGRGRAAPVMMLALLPLTATACSSSSERSTKDAEGVDHIQVAVSNYTSVPYGLPYLVADKQGMFKKNRIAVDKVVSSTGGGTTIRLLMSGDLAFADASVNASLQAVQQGSDVKIVGGGTQSVRDGCTLVRKDAPFKSFEELAGRTIGYTNPGSASEGITRLYVARSGLGQDDFTLKATGGMREGLALLQKGAVDLVPGVGPLCSDPRFKVLDTTELVPRFQVTTTITSAKFAREQPDLVKRFLASLHEANLWVRKNPEAAGDMLAAHLQQPAEPVRSLVSELVKDPAHWDVGLDPEPVNAALAGARLSGITEADTQPLENILDQSHLPQGVSKVDPSQLSSEPGR